MHGTETANATELAIILKMTGRAVRLQAENQGWKYQKGPNRTKFYYIDSLPVSIQASLRAYRLKKNIVDQGNNIIMQNSLNIVPRQLQNLKVRQQDGPFPMLSEKRHKAGAAWADLVRLYLEYVDRRAFAGGSIVEAKEDFEKIYKAGIYPNLLSILGPKDWKTIEKRAKIVKDGCLDTITKFAPQYGSNRGKRSITPAQAEIVLSIIRSPYQPKKISEIIKISKAFMHQRGVEDGLSDATYRRFIEEWIERHNDQWIFWREGEKGLHDKCLYWIERDYDRIDVGDVLIADGHTINFETLNPWTGKPKRMTLILWYDMKSNFPCGWEVMPSENTQAINSALRRAIIMLGKVPKIVYLDNGKAFSAKFFNGVDFEEKGFTGVYERLGIKPVYAWPYHPQSKTIERFFESFAELERMAPSYVGTSIADKPPRLSMGEKTHRRIHEKITGGIIPTLEETHNAIAAWFDVYTKREQQSGHLKGIRPIDVFMAGQGPGVDRDKLRNLMMTMDIRRIRRRGIKLPWGWYYNPDLYGRTHQVIIKYDEQDKNSIFVYQGDEFICEATLAEKVHPMAQYLGDDDDKALLEKEIELKNSLKKRTLTDARELLNTVVIPETKKQIESAGFALEAQGSGLKAQGESSKIKHLPLTDEARARIQEEFKTAEREFDEAEQTSWDDLAKLADMDRYEKLLEYEAQNTLIPRDEQAFMRYFEQTRQYLVNTDYFIEYRNKMTMMYQTN